MLLLLLLLLPLPSLRLVILLLLLLVDRSAEACFDNDTPSMFVGRRKADDCRTTTCCQLFKTASRKNFVVVFVVVVTVDLVLVLGHRKLIPVASAALPEDQFVRLLALRTVALACLSGKIKAVTSCSSKIALRCFQKLHASTH